MLLAETEASVTAKVSRRTVTGSPRCSANVPSNFLIKLHHTVWERTDNVLKAKKCPNKILTNNIVM